MNKLHIHLLGRFLIVMTLVYSLSVSTLGGVLEVGASAISTEPQTKERQQTVKSVKNKTYNDIDRAWRYDGHWTKSKLHRAFGGQFHTSNAIQDYATIFVEGSQFTLIYSTAPNYGELDVFVDELKVDTIDQSKSKTTSYQEEWTSPEIVSGTHELKFVHASGKSVNIDAIKVHGPKSNPDQPTAIPPFTETPTILPPASPVASPTGSLPAENPTSLPTEAVSSPTLSPAPTFTAAPTQTQTSSPTTSSTATFSPTATQSATPTQAPTTTTATIVVSAGESIQTKCVNAASAGATCEVNSGTYLERVTVSKPINLICKGTCVVNGGFDITANQAALRGFEVTGRGITIKGQYNVVENNYIHDLTSEVGILLYDGLNTNHITIKGNTIVRANNACILIAGNNSLMEGNDCSNTKQPQTSSGDADCFRYFGGNHVLRSNYCHDIWYGPSGYNPDVGDYVGDTAHIDCFQTWNAGDRGGAGHDTLFEKNFCDLPDAQGQITAKAFQTTGLTASRTIDLTKDYPCRNLTFKNNVIHSNFLAIFNYCQNITLLNNTFVGDTASSALGLQIQNLRGTNTIQYNIFVDQDNQAFTVYSADASATILGGYNVIYHSSGVPVGSPQPGDLWDIDPQFVDPAAKDYRLKPGSPACGMGAFPCQ